MAQASLMIPCSIPDLPPVVFYALRSLVEVIVLVPLWAFVWVGVELLAWSWIGIRYDGCFAGKLHPNAQDGRMGKKPAPTDTRYGIFLP